MDIPSINTAIPASFECKVLVLFIEKNVVMEKEKQFLPDILVKTPAVTENDEVLQRNSGVGNEKV